MTRVTARVLLKALILSVCLLWSAQSAVATTVIRPLDDDMIVGARAIVTGKVLQIETAIDQRQDRIYTYITVRVSEVIKGQITDRKIILKEPGGVVGDRFSVIYGSANFKLGEKVLLYLGTWNDGSLRTYQLFLGKFAIVKDEATGSQVVARDLGGESVTMLPGGQQGESTDRMELSSYTDMVRTRLAANLDRSQSFEEKYFKNVPILSTPSGFVSSKKQVKPDYTFLNNLRWFEPDSGQPVPYTFNPNPSSTPGVPSAVVDPNDVAAAANVWSVVPGCSLRLSYSGILNDCYSSGGPFGINIVSNNCDGWNQPTAGCSITLAIGGSSGRIGSQTRVIGGITFGQLTQGFVSFNPWSCEFADHCRVQEIATHELGHALGLAHSADPTATMYYIAHFDGRCAGLKQDDMNGISFLYPGSGGGGGPLAVVTSSLPAGTAGTSYSQIVTASGGTLPYNWSVVAGAGSLPTGLSLSSAGGTISGTPTTAGTYNFTVKVTDAASGTAQKALSIVVAATGAAAFDAQFVSQSVPTALTPSQAFDVNMKFLNTGTQTWSGAAMYLASQNPALNSTWGGQAVSLSSFVIAPGQQLDVTFTAFAPAIPGTYNFQWQPYQYQGVSFFGQMSTNIVIQVGSAPPPPVDNGALVSQSVPTSMIPGHVVSVSVTMSNTGTTTWAAGSYYLGSQNPQGNTTWGLNRVNLGSAVAPGGQGTFTFNVTAPTTAGTYNFQWQMSNGAAFFGQMSTNVSVSVASQPVYQGFNDGAGCNTISGWAWDPANPNTALNIDLYDGNTFIATTTANMYREDLLNALGSPNHGFSFNTPASLKNGAVHTVNVKFSGTSTLLSSTGRAIQCTGAPSLFGRHDGQGSSAIEGWAWDANNPTGTVNVDIYDGSTLLGSVAATLYRQDLADALSSPYHGFIFHTPASLRDGQVHMVTVKFGGTNTNLPLDTPRMSNFPSIAANYQGHHDIADCNMISGYAWDSNDDGGTINAAIYVDGGFYVVVPAQEAYPGIGNGYHGFKFAVPASFKDNKPHTIQVKFSGTSSSLLNTSKTIQCP